MKVKLLKKLILGLGLVLSRITIGYSQQVDMGVVVGSTHFKSKWNQGSFISYGYQAQVKRFYTGLSTGNAEGKKIQTNIDASWFDWHNKVSEYVEYGATDLWFGYETSDEGKVIVGVHAGYSSIHSVVRGYYNSNVSNLVYTEYSDYGSKGSFLYGMRVKANISPTVKIACQINGTSDHASILGEVLFIIN